MNEKLYSIQELEKIFNVTRQAITAWINEGKLRAFKAGKYWRIKQSDLNNYIENNYNK